MEERYLDYTFQKHSIKRKHRSHHMLKVPQQEISSNLCAVFVSLFIKYFLKDIEKYEKCPNDFILMEHKRFSNKDATMERNKWHRTLHTLFTLH
ncbi:uncharacterized protein LOC124437440 isoform X2 [Xenia sp. Carnegie-2017]|uniref:uncharacterized protein LOC124437440 isoform X2 n=1 Tax=Xenia sp. Carnegie-2017 TaxID=2897299 RepID=UPI001F048579|nr:uncharacterized protein LOC124437440 isoform X2 [Xenia sp. Carnegie-2017]